MLASSCETKATSIGVAAISFTCSPSNTALLDGGRVPFVARRWGDRAAGDSDPTTTATWVASGTRGGRCRVLQIAMTHRCVAGEVAQYRVVIAGIDGGALTFDAPPQAPEGADPVAMTESVRSRSEPLGIVLEQLVALSSQRLGSERLRSGLGGRPTRPLLPFTSGTSRRPLRAEKQKPPDCSEG